MIKAIFVLVITFSNGDVQRSEPVYTKYSCQTIKVLSQQKTESFKSIKKIDVLCQQVKTDPTY